MKIMTLSALVFFAIISSGCRTLTDEALCQRDRDCPEEFPFCGETRDDAGVGVCANEEPPVDIVDAGPFVFDQADAAVSDETE